MENEPIDLLRGGHLSPLPAAFLRDEHRDLLAPLRFLLPEEVPDPVAGPPSRSEVARALARANASYGHSRAGFLADKLADPTTRVVITGQQPGLFGGPLYSLTKALAAEAWAARLEEAGQPAVALFWVATEDHDWAESSRATWLPDSALLTTELGDDPSPLSPMGMRTFGPELPTAFAKIEERARSPRYRELVDRLKLWYKPDARFGEAFSRLMVDLLGENAPLFVDSQLHELKQAQAPFLERLVERRDDVARELAAQEAAIEARGLPLQVRPQEAAGELFVLRDGRRRVLWQGVDSFSLRGRDATRPVDELLQTIAENPAVVTPGALSRPVVQDAVFGTTLQVLGPGELSYFAQSAALYRSLEVPAPAVALRPQFLLLDPRQQEHLESLGLPLAEVFAADADLDALMTKGRDVDPSPQAREEAASWLEELRAQALAIDPSLAKAWEKTRQQVERALEAFSSRVVAAAARQDEVRRRRLEGLRLALRPGGVPQERRLAVAHFAARYGGGLVPSLRRQMDLDPRHLHVVDPSSAGNREGETSVGESKAQEGGGAE